jgi:hypothetical protein
VKLDTTFKFPFKSLNESLKGAQNWLETMQNAFNKMLVDKTMNTSEYSRKAGCFHLEAEEDFNFPKCHKAK